ncbi:alpha/beta fold hydrolase [Crossiella cryophila]|uniref:Pimeloyl-ACP methyl ester carboxylesterase n=1 Tax=Crossiella cryophila TaxID=43355 RepID=A0A7W7C8J8_9PSEU|nr:alpha/beta fold hydrolase [Crossiella cryophila]MBB4676542.1 pimeloyl-ACP methyl ester carboxylesterase [Crossiella cryophila]
MRRTTAARGGWPRAAALTLGLLGLLGSQVVTATQPAEAAETANPAALKEFYSQVPNWQPCKFNSALDCATLVVPMDYGKPKQERIALSVSRLKASDPAKRRGILLSNPGGPGGSGLALPTYFYGTPLTEVYDLIGFDPRGVNESTLLSCEVTTDLHKLSSRPEDKDFAAWTASARQSEEACRKAGGALRKHVNTPNTARDMDVIRGVLGEKKLSYVGYSYGTYLGAVYGSLFPKQLDRSVLDSSVHPEWIWRQQFKQQSVAFRDNVDLWAEWAGQRNNRFGIGKTKAEVLATVEQVAAKLHATPADGFDRTQFDAGVGGGARYRFNWEFLAEDVKYFRDFQPGSAEFAEAAKAGKELATLGLAQLRAGVFDTVTCEADWPRDLNSYYQDMREFRDRYPYGLGVTRAAPRTCTFRSFTPPEKPVKLKRKGYQTGVVIQADGDTQTHYDGGPAMAERLEDHLISVADEGRHGLYALGGNTCVDEHVNRYLVDGVLPPSRVICAGTPRPDVPTDAESASSRSRRLAPTPPGALAEKVRQAAVANKVANLPF